MSRKVIVTGMGIITSIGKNSDEHVLALKNKKHGFAPVTFLQTSRKNEIPCFEIKLSDNQLMELCGVKNNTGYTRTSLLGLYAAQQAIQSSSFFKTPGFKYGFISANTVGGMSSIENIYYDLLDTDKKGDFEVYAESMDGGESTERIAEHIGITEYATTISTACSSSANSILHAAERIKAGLLDRVICGGTDALCKLTLNGFDSLKILDHNHCRPFDESRFGVNLGEGAAFLILEAEDVAFQLNRPALAVLSGYSNSNDAFHQTASSPDGNGAYMSMQNALKMASLNENDIQYINAHGTATPNNDLSESIAIERLFGKTNVKFSSTKAFTGHTLGAAGAVEAVFSILSLLENAVWPNLNFTSKMPESTLVPQTDYLQLHAIQHVLSNSFGFGGNNTSLLFSKYQK